MSPLFSVSIGVGIGIGVGVGIVVLVKVQVFYKEDIGAPFEVAGQGGADEQFAGEEKVHEEINRGGGVL